MRRLVLTAVVLLAACGIDAGTVTSRSYEDPHEEQILICSGNPMVCVPYPSHVPECWRITFFDGEDENSACVGRSTWDSLKAGDHFDINTVEMAG